MTQRVLIQLDSDLHPSSFDSIVAIDAGVDHLLRYGDVQVTGVEPLVHGAMFTRGPDELKHTAIFIGGSDVDAAQRLLSACSDAFFGPMRVSLMLDANGCNTTAAAAVVAAGRHLDLKGARAVVLGATGPVGRRVSQLLADEDATVVVTSRSIERAEKACKEIRQQQSKGELIPVAIGSGTTREALVGAEVIIGCGAAGVQLIDESSIKQIETLKVAIDLNAVPPAGIGGIEVTDKAKSIGQEAVAYGAIGVGGLKMKTHRAAIQSLFESNDKVLDAAEVYRIAKAIG